MTKAEKAHLSRLADIGCIACRLDGHHDTPAEIHHLREGMGMGQRNNHYRAIPLCPAHHRGTQGIKIPSVHGTPDLFRKTFGTELELLNRVNELLGESRAA